MMPWTPIKRKSDEVIAAIMQYLISNNATSPDRRVTDISTPENRPNDTPLIDIIADPNIGNWGENIDFVVYTGCVFKMEGDKTFIHPPQYSPRYIVYLSEDKTKVLRVVRDWIDTSWPMLIATSGMPAHSYDIGNMMLYKSNEQFVREKIAPLAKR